LLIDFDSDACLALKGL